MTPRQLLDIVVWGFIWAVLITGAYIVSGAGLP